MLQSRFAFHADITGFKKLMTINIRYALPFLLLTACTHKEPIMNNNPLTIVTTCQPDRAPVLHTPAKDVEFPLSQEIKDLIAGMKDLMEHKLYAAGLAAVQVGAPYKVIVYQVTPEALKIREDARDVVPPTALINPSYEIIQGSGTTFDWEFCFSVLDQGGKVTRPTSIKYTGYDEDGHFIEGEAHGFLARLLQHEIDHVNGLLCSRLYPSGGFYGPRDAMFKIREEEIAKKKELST
ncbi:MAG: peptide deformylase [Alphaproteobacteria bacterium]|nr:peptide deformylase [Alphaproteobacteria bacterium]